MIKTITALAAALTAVSTASAQTVQSGQQQQMPQFAQVVNIQPNIVTEQRQVCDQQPVTSAPQQSSVPGMILGTVIGAAIGNQIGGGSGKQIATASGAVIGGAIGSGAVGVDQQPQQVCRVVQTQRQTGVSVTFSYNGRLFTQVFDN